MGRKIRYDRIAALLAVIMIAALFGCSDDDGQSGNDSSVTNTDAATTSADAGPTATVSGTVETFSLTGTVPVGGVNVSVIGATPAISTTTDETGAFSLAVPLDQPLFLEFTEAAQMTIRLGLIVPAEGITDLPVFTLTPTLMNVLLGSVEAPTQDPTKGVVFVDFDGDSKLGGEKAILNLAHDSSVTLDGENHPVVSDTLIVDGSGLLAFPNVEVGDATFTFEATTGSCALRYPDLATYPVLASSITLVRALCSH